MLTLNEYRGLRRDFSPQRTDADRRKAFRALSLALQEGELQPHEFSLRHLAEHVVEDGREWVATLDPRFGTAEFRESVDAVSTAAFTNITGQIIYSRMMAAYQAEDFVFSRIIPHQATALSGEKIPGVSNLGDAAQTVSEGNAYPNVGVGEDYIETPATTKRGLIVPVTKEAIFFDRTGLVLERASKVGESLGLNKEKRLVDCVIDLNSTNHRYKWRGTTIATYGNSSGTHSWDNLQASNGLVDYTDIDNAEQLLAAMTDPNTGEPMSMMADTLIVTPQLRTQAKIALGAVSVALHAGGYTTSGNLIQTNAGNPLGGTEYSGAYRVVTSRLLAARLVAGSDVATTWFLGRPSAAFVYMENWPITFSTAPPNSSLEFERDIVAQYKASERGAAATLEPRYMVRNTVA